MRTLVDFVVIGAMKAGSTSLFRILRQHPETRMCTVKEPGFFTLHSQFKQGSWELGPDRYDALFPPGPGIRGEASTSYTKYPISRGIAERMYAINPHLRLIYLMRHPLARSISHYLHMVRMGREVEDISKALAKAESNYVLFSRYHLQLQAFLEYFPVSQILPLVSEEMWQDPKAEIRKVLGFLGLDWPNSPFNCDVRANSTQTAAENLPISALTNQQLLLRELARSHPRGMSALEIGEALGLSREHRLVLQDAFCEDLEALFQFIGRRVDVWHFES